jgi:Flp pilus assembly secretin CpaC
MVAAFLSAAGAALAEEGGVVTLSLNDAGQVRPHRMTTRAASYRGSEAQHESYADLVPGEWKRMAEAGMPNEATHPTVTLQVGGGSRFTVERPFETVLIGNLAVIDVQTQDESSVLLKPLRPGTTNLVFIDKQGIVITNLMVLVREAGAI